MSKEEQEEQKYGGLDIQVYFGRECFKQFTDQKGDYY